MSHDLECKIPTGAAMNIIFLFNLIGFSILLTALVSMVPKLKKVIPNLSYVLLVCVLAL